MTTPTFHSGPYRQSSREQTHEDGRRPLRTGEMENGHGEEYDQNSGPYSAARSYPSEPRRPLIHYIKNEWRNSTLGGGGATAWSTSSQAPQMSRSRLWLERTADKIEDAGLFVLSIISAPRFRRYLVVYLLFMGLTWSTWATLIGPRWKEHKDLMNSLDRVASESKNGWFGSNARAFFSDMIQVKDLDSVYLPLETIPTTGLTDRRRLVFVGDVHGCKDELVELLAKIEFNPGNGDHLVLTGDVVSKGPDSAGAVDLARRLGASCVRGNHEDRVLLVHRNARMAAFVPLQGPTESAEAIKAVDHLDEESFSQGDYSDRAMASSLSTEQLDWLGSCPLILRVGEIKDMGEVVVTHAGLVPGVDLQRQDPAAVMAMRTIDLETHVPSKESKGTPWYKVSRHKPQFYHYNKAS